MIIRRKTQQFLAAFSIACILVLGLCGFILVDLSSDRYMPSEYGPLFLIRSVNQEGMELAALGEEYQISSESGACVHEILWRFRGILPRTVFQAAEVTVKAYTAWQAHQESLHNDQELW